MEVRKEEQTQCQVNKDKGIIKERMCNVDWRPMLKWKHSR